VNRWTGSIVAVAPKQGSRVFFWLQRAPVAYGSHHNGSFPTTTTTTTASDSGGSGGSGGSKS
jgi:hypothetical protein